MDGTNGIFRELRFTLQFIWHIFFLIFLMTVSGCIYYTLSFRKRQLVNFGFVERCLSHLYLCNFIGKVIRATIFKSEGVRIWPNEFLNFSNVRCLIFTAWFLLLTFDIRRSKDSSCALDYYRPIRRQLINSV